MAELLDIDELAEQLDRTVATIRRWRTKGLPEADRGKHGALLFNVQDARDWAIRKGYIEGQVSSPATIEGVELDDKEGLAGAVHRLEQMELLASCKAYRSLEKGDGASASIKRCNEVVKELRLAAKALREEKQARGELIPRSQHMTRLTNLAAQFRRYLEALADEAAPGAARQCAGALGAEDYGAVERAIHSAIEEAADNYLQKLSENIRQQKGAD